MSFRLRNFLQSSLLRQSPLFDGTISELANTLYIDDIADADRYADMIEHSGLGYVQMSIRPFKTRDIDDYKAIVNDPARWAAFDALMDKYFNDHIDLFPFAQGRARQKADAARGDSQHKGQQFPNPEAFHLVQKDMIERRFSIGDVNDIGERDLRDAISGLRYVFVRNFWRLVLCRRRAALGASIWMTLGLTGLALVLVAIAHGLFGDLASPMQIQVGVGLLSALLLGGAALAWTNARHLIKRHSDEYASAIEATCNALARPLNIRIHDLIQVIPLLFHNIDKSKMELKSTGQILEWPTEVKKWSKLAFWLDARVEHIELYMQVQMWRIRRMHFGMRWIGVKLSSLLGVTGILIPVCIVAAGLAGILASPRHALSAMPAAALLIMGVVIAFVVSDLARKTYRMMTPDIDIIEKTLKTADMKGYRDVRLNEKFADFSFQEKSLQLHEEDKLKR